MPGGDIESVLDARLGCPCKKWALSILVRLLGLTLMEIGCENRREFCV